MTQFQPHDPMTRAQPSKSGGGKKLLIGGCLGCGGLIALVIVAFIIFSLWVSSLPVSGVQTHSTTPPEIIQALQDASLLDTDEQIIMIYSAGIVSMRTDGLYFTDRRVVSYMNVDDKSSAMQAPYDEIVNIILEESETMLDDSYIFVQLENGGTIIGPVNNLEGEDLRFHARLLQEWQTQSGRAP